MTQINSDKLKSTQTNFKVLRQTQINSDKLRQTQNMRNPPNPHRLIKVLYAGRGKRDKIVKLEGHLNKANQTK